MGPLVRKSELHLEDFIQLGTLGQNFMGVN